MTNLLLIRHAETDMAGTFCGHSNPPVNVAGYRQIEQLAIRLRAEPLEAIFTSDLLRAVATAEALTQVLRVPHFIRPALREINFGDWEGMRWEEIELEEPAIAAKWLRSFPQMPAPSGESFAQFETRVLDELTHLLNAALSRSIAVVTHAGVLRVILRNICAIDESDAWQITKSYCAAIRVVDGICQPIRCVEQDQFAPFKVIAGKKLDGRFRYEHRNKAR